MRSPDLVLIYLEDGQRSIDLLKEMVNLNPSIPVIVMAEKGSERLAVEAFRGGAWDYFSQPIDIKELSNRISSLLGIPLQQEKRNFNSLIKAIKFINENYTKHLKLSDIARISCMSVSTFERIFKKEIGVTFITYVNRLRISKAINLLKEDMSMNEIAVTCGFTSQSHFCRVFKNITGISPREYKRSM
jgi:transcriptional regulator GlxA family with amidase domain